jgi:hypothetical protein
MVFPHLASYCPLSAKEGRKEGKKEGIYCCIIIISMQNLIPCLSGYPVVSLCFDCDMTLASLRNSDRLCGPAHFTLLFQLLHASSPFRCVFLSFLQQLSLTPSQAFCWHFFPLDCFNISSILHQQLVLCSYYVIDCFFMEHCVFYFKVFHLPLTDRLWLVITNYLLAGFRNLPLAGVE